MAPPRGEFTTLLRDLRAAGPIDRVRLLARSLKALRGLSPWDRKVLLRMAGFEGAETLVERLAQDDEETAARLRRLLGQIEERPDELERTVRGLADPERRGEAVDEILATLDRGMSTGEEEAIESPEAPAGEGVPDPVPAPPSTLDPVPGQPIPLAPPSEDRAPPSEAAEAAETPEPPLPEGRPDDRQEEALPEPQPEPKPEPEPPSTTPAAPAAPLFQPPDGPPASASGVLKRLLDLRSRASGADAPDAATLLRTLEAEIPFPWARRRAVQAWIEGGRAADLDGALALISELPAAADRTWCLATLAENGRWSDSDWERILEATPTSAARRRLERRRPSRRQLGIRN